MAEQQGGSSFVSRVAASFTAHVNPIRRERRDVEEKHEHAAGGKPSPWQGGSMNPNLYATKKTVAQGLLDVALLSVNATQLKQLLQLGPKHDFYIVMVTLISVSIALQVLVGVVFMALGFINVNKEKNQHSAEVLNNLATGAVFAVTVLNVLSASFDMRRPEASGGPLYAALP